MEEKKRRAAVVVLGDFGRSPRMQYHALSLSRQAEMEVDVVACSETQPHRAVLDDPNIHIHPLRPPTFLGWPRLLRPLILLVKAVTQFFYIAWFLMFRVPTPEFFLVQNPPSIPVLGVVKLAGLFQKARFIIDWHNFGYTLLALSLSRYHPLVIIHYWYERLFGKMADGHLCVTMAMQQELGEKWGINATVLYDKPPKFFRPASVEKRHELFLKLDGALRKPLGAWDCCSQYQNGELSSKQNQCTLFTSRVPRPDDSCSKFEIQENDLYLYRKGRPALIVSSTSWSADEDFGILLEAAVIYDRRVAASCKDQDGDLSCLPHESCPFPRLLFVITGKGPMREKYEEDLSKLRLRHVAFRTMWLSAEDYPILLGSADLGVSLHKSSSGLDLPMKVVDMFGCGLPVAAVSYACISELVKDGENGLLFSDSWQLAEHFVRLFRGFPDESKELERLRSGALASGEAARWDSEWERQVFPLLN